MYSVPERQYRVHLANLYLPFNAHAGYHYGSDMFGHYPPNDKDWELTEPSKYEESLSSIKKTGTFWF